MVIALRILQTIHRITSENWEIIVEFPAQVCYTDSREANAGENPICVSRQYLPQPYGSDGVPYLAQQRHVSGEFEVDSAALSSEEIGNGIYPPARRILVKHGVPCTEHRARQITPEDFETADLIIGMEWGHLKKLRALCPKERQAKLHLLLDFAERQGDIEDPWYTDDFDRAYRDILRGCEGLLRNLTENKTA